MSTSATLLSLGAASGLVAACFVYGEDSSYEFFLGLSFIFFTFSYFSIVSEAAKVGSIASIAIPPGLYAIVGVVVLTAGIAWVGCILLVVSIIMVVYGLYMWEKYKRRSEEEVRTNSFSGSSAPAKPVNPVDDDDPAGIL